MFEIILKNIGTYVKPLENATKFRLSSVYLGATSAIYISAQNTHTYIAGDRRMRVSLCECEYAVLLNRVVGVSFSLSIEDRTRTEPIHVCSEQVSWSIP